MGLFEPTGPGRVATIILPILIFFYLILSLVSFGGVAWITYVDTPLQFGLWRICDTSAATGGCAQWASTTFTSINVVFAFPNGKPGFVRAAQALEIISFLFYIFSAALIIIGILNINGLSPRILFIVSALLLFICIIFIIASLGVMGDKGRNTHPGAYLDWAWWTGLAGLFIILITFIILIIEVIDMTLFKSPMYRPPKMSKGRRLNQIPGSALPYPLAMGGNFPPMATVDSLIPELYHDPIYNQYPLGDNFDGYFQNPPMVYGGQFQNDPYYGEHSFNDRSPSPLISALVQQYISPSGDPYYGNHSFNDRSPSPLLSAVLREHIIESNDALFEREVLDSYGQYPYIINNYL